ncbi:MAG: hypothetical protein AAGJ85_06880 [Pseudomonadota bacterium]
MRAGHEVVCDGAGEEIVPAWVVLCKRDGVIGFEQDDRFTAADPACAVGGMFAKMAGSFGSDWFKNVTYSSKKAAEARMKAADAANRAAEKVTDDENAWLMKRLGWDGKVSPAEEALLKFLREEVPGFVEGLAVAA